jgi:PIN domain nuclease of toxin-antitoxin system
MGELSFLLDTCTLLWWWSSPPELSPKCLSLLKDPSNRIYVSAASAWEIATKTRIGKLPSGSHILEAWQERLAKDGFSELPISTRHAIKAGLLPGAHRDPFDRMLAAQGLLEALPILTSDPQIAGLGAEMRW